MTDISKPIPIKLSTDLLAKIKYAADRLGISQQDTMRDAMKIGLKQWARIDYDTAGAVLDAPTTKGISILQGTFVAESDTEIVPINYTADELAQIAKSKRILKGKTDKAVARRKSRDRPGA